MKPYQKSERGQALILLTLGIVGLIALVGLAIDGGSAFLDRRNAQSAADSAALAAALGKLGNQGVNAIALAQAASNGYNNDGVSNTVTVRNPPGLGCNNVNSAYAGNSEYIQVIINSTIQTSIAHIAGVGQVENCVEATAHAKPGELGPLYDGFAIVGLKPSGCDAVYIAGNGQVQAWGGGIFSNSTSSCGLHFQGSSQTQTHEKSGGIMLVAGSYTITGNPSIQTHGEGIHPNQVQRPYPPANLPNPTCSGNASQSGSTMNPGNYVGGKGKNAFPPSGVTKLNPGVYCVYGDFTIHSSGDKLSGTGVTIVMMDGEMDWNGGEIKLSAPTSGPYQGLLVFAPMSNTSGAHLNGNANSTLRGTVYMPAGKIFVNGNNTQLQKADSKLVGYEVEISGSGDVQIEMDSNSQAKGSAAPEIELSQ